MLWLALAISITSSLVAERCLFACLAFLFYIFRQGPDKKSSFFVSSIIQNGMALVTNILNAFVNIFTVSVSKLILVAVFLLLWGVLYTCANYSSYALVAFQTAYNDSIGGSFRMAFVIPAQLTQLIWNGIVPVYNLGIYCIKTIPTRILLENVLLNFSDFRSAAMHLGLFISNLTASLYTYIQTILRPPDSFDPNLRLLDLVTPLAHWRLCVSYLLSWSSHVCSVGSSLLDIMVYPFMDINFGLGVHNLINSVLTLIVQVPTVTIQRCAAGGGPVVYCLPDFEPVIELAVNGVRNMGLLVDNWIDVTTIIIQAALTNTSPACSGWSTVMNMTSDLIGQNETVVVGVDSNHYVLTDGWNAVVYSRTEHQNFPALFPFAVNINYGVAIVSVTSNLRGLLGCTCNDLEYGMQLLCAVAPLDSLTPAYYVPVEFNVPSTSFFMGCGKAKIRLDSIRWPVTRYTSPNSDARASPTAEAALYVMPMCSSEQIDVACVDTFKLANCFPYCMALWTRGYTGSMVLRGGEEWSNTVSMVQRDCGLHTWDLKSGEIGTLTDNLRKKSGVKSPWIDAEVQLDSSRCTYAPNTLSRMLRNNTPSYSAYRSVRLSDQPFAFAGDLILTAVNTVGDTWGVDVQRIWGNQDNEFTVVHVNKFIPALPPCKTPSDCTAAANSCGTGRCLVSVPYSFDSTPWVNIPSVATDRYVFWITNPSMAMYWAFNQWCNQKMGALAFEAESSYSSIQIWRMDPYEFCPIDVATGIRRCPEDNSATFRTLPGFVSGDHSEQVCTQSFLVVAPTITYVNPYNLAITVLNTTFVNVNTDTLRPIDAKKARYNTTACSRVGRERRRRTGSDTRRTHRTRR